MELIKADAWQQSMRLRQGKTPIYERKSYATTELVAL
jgi:hypothetical protein